VTGIGALEHFKSRRTSSATGQPAQRGGGRACGPRSKTVQTAKQLEKELETQKRRVPLIQIDELTGACKLLKD